MKDIHSQCIEHGTEGIINYVKGANIAGFIKGHSMIDQGVV